MAQRYALTAQSRTLLGKAVKQLRRQQILPGNVYGHNVPGMAVQVATGDFNNVLKTAGETGLIDLTVEGEAKTRPVLIHDILSDPVTGLPLHIDFYQVNLKEKLTASVPLSFTGESPLVTTHEGLLLEMLQEVEVECLPTDIPSSIEVDTTHLTELEQGMTVAELTLPSGVEMQTPGDEMVCKVTAPQMAEEVEETPVAEAGEEAVAEGETPDEEKTADA